MAGALRRTRSRVLLRPARLARRAAVLGLRVTNLARAARRSGQDARLVLCAAALGRAVAGLALRALTLVVGH